MRLAEVLPSQLGTDNIMEGCRTGGRRVDRRTSPRRSGYPERTTWDYLPLLRMKRQYENENAGFKVGVIEARPPLNNAKRGLPGQDIEIDSVCTSGQPVCVSFGDLFVGLVFHTLNPNDPDAADHVRLYYGADEELRMAIRLFGGVDMTPEDKPIEVLVLVEAREATGTLAEYADELAHWRLDHTTANGVIGFQAQHPALPTITYPYTETDPDPIGEALHVSPGFVLRPGELRHLIDGQAQAPYVAVADDGQHPP